jgi:hypothetical protein
MSYIKTYLLNGYVGYTRRFSWSILFRNTLVNEPLMTGAMFPSWRHLLYHHSTAFTNLTCKQVSRRFFVVLSVQHPLEYIVLRSLY